MKTLTVLMGQGFFTLGNLIMTVLVARTSSPDDFGAWSLGYATFMLALTLSRVVASTPLLISNEDNPNRLHELGRGSVSIASGIGLLLTILVSAITGITAADFRLPLIAFGAAAGLVLVQSSVRYYLIRVERYGLAALLDVSHFALQGIGYGVLLARDLDSPVTVSLAWGFGALPGTLVAIHALAVQPGISSGRRFLREHRWEGRRLLLDALINSASTAAIPYGLALIGGLGAAGALRAGQTLYGGIGLVVLAMTPLFTVESSRRLRAGVSGSQLLTRWSMLIAAVSAIYVILLLSIPRSVGVQLLGASWEAAAALLIPLGAHALLRGPVAGAPALLQAARALDAAVRLRVRTLAATLIPPLIGGAIAGAEGCAWGLALSAVVVSIQSYSQIARSLGK